MYSKNISCPCKSEPIILQPREYVRNFCYYVEQPVICPVNIKCVHHYIPRPVYYTTYAQQEENVCHGSLKTNQQTK